MFHSQEMESQMYFYFSPICIQKNGPLKYKYDLYIQQWAVFFFNFCDFR